MNGRAARVLIYSLDIEQSENNQSSYLYNWQDTGLLLPVCELEIYNTRSFDLTLKIFSFSCQYQKYHELCDACLEFHFAFLSVVLIVGIFHRSYPFVCYLHLFDMIKRMSKISLICSCSHKCPLFDSVSKLFMAFEMSQDILLLLQLLLQKTTVSCITCFICHLYVNIAGT